jgi:hypothetical protein
MHSERYRKAERDDGARCPGFEPLDTPHGVGCRNCSGLPEDHAGFAELAQEKAKEPTETTSQLTLF